jgi:6-phosphogluconolactonase
MHVSPDPEAVSRDAARAIQDAAKEAIDARGRFVLALAGGSTPKRTYEQLAADPSALDWSRVYVVFGDERCVPPTHPDSNQRMAAAALLSKVPIPTSHVLKVPCDDGDNLRAASAYNTALRTLIEMGSIDLVLLGVGSDGHTASLFASAEDSEATLELSALTREDLSRTVLPRLVVPTVAPPTSPIAKRVSLSFSAIRDAERVFILVTGKDKTERLAEAMRGAEAIPIGRVVSDRDGDVDVYADLAAAGQPGD